MALTSTTDSGSILAIRSADLSAQLGNVKETARSLSHIDGTLYRRVAHRLDELVAQCEAALKDASDVTGSQTGWKKLRTAQNQIALLSRETLAFTEGALLRRNAAGGSFCALADKLLDYFNDVERTLNWHGFTILAETAFLGRLGEVVRLRFPETSIWHLPVAAHEFGHYANPTIRVEVQDGSFVGHQYPVEDYLRGLWKSSYQKPWFHAHEFMADIFAVYTLGAAYAYCVLFLRPDPGTLRAETTTHPSWNERYYVILETLRRSVGHGGITPQVLSDIEGRWERSLSGSAGSKKPDADKLNGVVEFFFPLLDANLRGVRYATFNRAQQLVSPLRSGDGLQSSTIPDIMNAAWIARVHNIDDQREAAKIGRNATKACEAV